MTQRRPGPVVPPPETLSTHRSFEYWERESRPVLQLLSEPHDWVFLNKWVRQNSFGHSHFRQVLAWLEDRKKALSFTSTRVNPATGKMTTRVYWVSRAWWAAHDRKSRS